MTGAELERSGTNTAADLLARFVTNSLFFTAALSGTVDYGGGPLNSTDAFDATLAAFTIQPSPPALLHVWSARYAGVGQQNGPRLGLTPAGGLLLAISSSGGSVDFGMGPSGQIGQSPFALIGQ